MLPLFFRHVVTWNVTDSRTIHVRLTIVQMTVLDAGTYMLFAGRGPLGSSAAHASVSLESECPSAHARVQRQCIYIQVSTACNNIVIHSGKWGKTIFGFAAS